MVLQLPRGDGLVACFSLKNIIMLMNKVLSNAVLENICNLLGDTNNGLTGTQIHDFLVQSNIEDVDCKGVMIAKRKKLLMAFQQFQKSSNVLITFLCLYKM